MGIDGPLSGVRILDLTNVLAGPYCCYQLALMGADVTKVERPGQGDLARQLGADPGRNQTNMGLSFLAQNAQKKSITLNLKTDDGRALFLKLVATADVVVENYRPDVMGRLGLGYDVLKKTQPDLIYCAISGFGQDGPWKDNPAYDQIVQGISGVMSITGNADDDPTRVGYPIADTIGGMTAAFAISAALNERPRGRNIDISMTDAVISTMGWVVSNYLMGGVAPARHGNENTTSAPSGTFRVQDGMINIAANKQEQWEALANHIDRTDLLTDPRFLSREDRKANRLTLRTEIEKTLLTQTAAHWLKGLSEIGVPAGSVMGVDQVLSSDQITGRSLISDNLYCLDEPLSVVGSPVMMNGARPQPIIAPPELGQHNMEIYQNLGLSATDIDDLKKRGVI
ncbi:CaiB/BaiF CoA transferase family protein [Parasulfitobacter algicola]|uniref:CoA transferase n=1 Tax=Parasulfitobacter algicola TaxID=2614809 RepID=A0ABX2ITK5_9RHOB|nr:CaiB/BaiF CoA-transferase family protein [Sulfitobacter algicola]NSX53503.1 CoA transferase [Sulfitobacter algicola]